jgi:hypothetical protein
MAEKLPLAVERDMCRGTGEAGVWEWFLQQPAYEEELGKVCEFRINTVTWGRTDSFFRLMAQMVEPPNND